NALLTLWPDRTHRPGLALRTGGTGNTCAGGARAQLAGRVFEAQRLVLLGRRGQRAHAHGAVAAHHQVRRAAAAVQDHHVAQGRRLDLDVLLRQRSLPAHGGEQDGAGEHSASVAVWVHGQALFWMRCALRCSAAAAASASASNSTRLPARPPTGICIAGCAPVPAPVPNQPAALPRPPWLVCVGARCWPVACTSDT